MSIIIFSVLRLFKVNLETHTHKHARTHTCMYARRRARTHPLRHIHKHTLTGYRKLEDTEEQEVKGIEEYVTSHNQ